MTTGKERKEVYKYMAEIMERPVYTHELADENVRLELQKRCLNDFVKLCEK